MKKIKLTVVLAMVAIMLALAVPAQACACGGDPYEAVSGWNSTSAYGKEKVASYGHLPTPPPGYVYDENLYMVPAYVEAGTVPDEEFQQLLDAGWYGIPYDGMEAVYPPTSSAR